jgi:hypothetical protein
MAQKLRLKNPTLMLKKGNTVKYQSDSSCIKSHRIAATTQACQQSGVDLNRTDNEKHH